jgi:biotin operon repressor
MRYVNKFAQQDFLSLLSVDPVSTSEIMRQLGCCRSTAKGYLSQLQKQGKIRKITILGSRSYGWVISDSKNR